MVVVDVCACGSGGFSYGVVVVGADTVLALRQLALCDGVFLVVVVHVRVCGGGGGQNVLVLIKEPISSDKETQTINKEEVGNHLKHIYI